MDPTSRTAPRPVPALLVLLLFLVAPLAAPVSGQSPVSTEMPTGDGAVLPDAERAVQVIEDPAEDAGLFPLFAPVGPGGPLDQMADITDLTIAETEDALRFDLTHRGYDGGLLTTSQAAEGTYFCQMAFHINSIDTYTYTIYFEADLGDDLQTVYYAGAERLERSGDRWQWDWLGNVPVGFVDDHFSFSLDKSWLSVAPRDRALQPDDRLSDLEVICVYSSGAIVAGAYIDEASSDEAGTGTGSYTIASAPGSSMVAVSFLGPDGPLDPQSTLAVAVGGPTKQTLELTNHAERKLLVNMSARVTDGAGTMLDGWDVVVPPTVEVGTDEPGRATLVVTPPADAAHRQGGVLELVASPLGHDEPARVTRPVSAAVPLSPDNDTLWFHNGWRGGCMLTDCLTPDEAPALFEQDPEWFVLAPVEQHPVYGREQVDSGKVRLRNWQDAGTVLDLPLPKPIRFDPEGTIDVTLGLSGDIEREMAVRLDLVVDWGQEHIGGVEKTITLTAEATEYTFSVAPREEMLDLAAGTEIQMLLNVREATAGTRVYGSGGPLDFYPDRSRMTFPLLPLGDSSMAITDGRALPTIQTRNGTELEEYTNPGKRQVYDLALVNEGSEEDILKVEATVDHDDWGIQILPGNRFKLGPGNAAPFSLVVTAPEDAAEGEIATVVLSATSANDDAVQTTVEVRTMVTHGVTFDDEEYVCSPDGVDPYMDDTEEASAAAVLLLVPFAIGLLGPFLRRRR